MLLFKNIYIDFTVQDDYNAINRIVIILHREVNIYILK